MNVNWSTSASELELHRYPKGQHDKSLQAWDSADELIVNHCQAQADLALPLLVLNDMFGAIALGLNNLSPTLVTDSEISKRAIAQNAKLNQQAPPLILSSLDDWPDCNTVLIKLTKNLGYLEFQLQQIANLTEPVNVIATGKTTQVTSKVLALFEAYLSEVTTSLAKKKSRLVFATHSGEQSLVRKQAHKSQFPSSFDWPERELTLHAHANVFSKDQVDIGGRFLADNLPELKPGQHIIDLGCGNGLLGLCALQEAQQQGIDVNLSFFDESFMAVRSAELNVEHNFSELLSLCQFIQDDCLSGADDKSADLILCNPPFHQQNTITEHIAEQMFQDAHRVLRVGGQLLVVANRHLPYQKALKKRFGGFKLAAQNNKFVIYSCQKKEITCG